MHLIGATQFLIKSRKTGCEAISASMSTGSERRFGWISSADAEGVRRDRIPRSKLGRDIRNSYRHEHQIRHRQFGAALQKKMLQSGSRPCANLHRATNLTARFNCCISEPALQSLQGAHLIADRDSHLDEFRRKAVQSVGNPGVKR